LSSVRTAVLRSDGLCWEASRSRWQLSRVVPCGWPVVSSSAATPSRMWPAGTEARLIAVDNTVRPSASISLLPQAAAWVNESNEEQRAKSLAMLAQAADALLEAGLAVSTHTPEGSPQELLTEQAAAWEADSIFVGARGCGGAAWAIPSRPCLNGADHTRALFGRAHSILSIPLVPRPVIGRTHR
jgi:nucleotide-binding universal stress UspA family protein